MSWRPTAATSAPERGDAERAADHAEHRQRAGGDAGLRPVDRVHRRHAHRRHHEAHAEAQQHERADEERRSSCRPRCATARTARPPTISSPATISGRGPIRSASRPAIGPATMITSVAGRKRTPASSGRVAEDVLHVEGEEEERRQHAERDHERDDVRPEELLGAQRLEVDHRRGGAPLDRPRRRRTATTLSASSAMMPGEPQPHALPSTSANTSAVSAAVMPAMPGMSTLRPTVSSRDSCAANSVTDDGAHGDGQVEEEDRAPGDLLGQPAAEHAGRRRARSPTRRPTSRSPCRAPRAGTRWR